MKKLFFQWFSRISTRSFIDIPTIPNGRLSAHSMQQPGKEKARGCVPAPFLEEKSRPSLRTAHDGDRGGHVRLDVHERKGCGDFHERGDDMRPRTGMPAAGAMRCVSIFIFIVILILIPLASCMA